jgi:hypothetical protein
MAHTRLAGWNEANLMIDPKATLGAARSRAHKAKKTASRLFVSGVGFSAAYFLDPDHGKARRQHALELIGRLLRSRADAARGDGTDLAEVPRPVHVASSRATFHETVNGAPKATRA